MLYTGGESKEGVQRKWFIHYYAPCIETGKPKRHREYGNLNSIKDIQQRYARAHVMMDEIARLGGRTGSQSALLDELAHMKVLIDKKLTAATAQQLHCYTPTLKPIRIST